MRTITRHALMPGFLGDAVDDLDAVATPEVAALCRATVEDSLPLVDQLRAWSTLKDKYRLSLCRFYDRADATHILNVRSRRVPAQAVTRARKKDPAHQCRVFVRINSDRSSEKPVKTKCQR